MVGPGPLTPATATATGLTADDCRLAASLERRAFRDPELRPGLVGKLRNVAFARARANADVLQRAAFWTALGSVIYGPVTGTGRLALGERDKDDRQPIVQTDLYALHADFDGLPLLYLDATLRPPLAHRIMPDLDITEIAASAPHMAVHLITGSFGRRNLCGPGSVGPVQQDRTRLLADCVTHVRWEALRVAPGEILVITHKDCEAAFAGIAGVRTAHFNAIAGLDAFRDVRLLIIIGRPLPPSQEVANLTGAFFGHIPEGGYAEHVVQLPTHDGPRIVRARQHNDADAEVLRAAICDDEVMQALGRGRGVNRTAANPLEVQILADVALPLEHASVVPWSAIVPDIVQQMLLTGIATDSPSDACRLHPDLFGNPEQAKKTIARVFKGQRSVYNSYRGLSLKSARYKQSGRGHGWQVAYWVDGSAGAVAAQLRAVLGDIADFEPC